MFVGLSIAVAEPSPGQAQQSPSLPKEKIWPLVKSKIAKFSSLRTYIPVYHEATLTNLLEVCEHYERDPDPETVSFRTQQTYVKHIVPSSFVCFPISGSGSLGRCSGHIYIYIYICIHILCIYTYIYIYYRERY